MCLYLCTNIPPRADSTVVKRKGNSFIIAADPDSPALCAELPQHGFRPRPPRGRHRTNAPKRQHLRVCVCERVLIFFPPPGYCIVWLDHRPPRKIPSGPISCVQMELFIFICMYVAQIKINKYGHVRLGLAGSGPLSVSECATINRVLKSRLVGT